MKRYKKLVDSNFSIFLCYVFIGILYFVKVLVSHQIIAPGDSLVQDYPLRMIYRNFLKDGIHLWTQYEFLGTSFLGILQSGILYPLNIIYILIPLEYSFNISKILHFCLAAFFTYLYIKQINVKKLPAFIGGIIFGFSGFIMAHKGHTSMMNAAAWLPLLLYFYEKIRLEKTIKYVIYAAFVVAIQVFAGHFQICVYSYVLLAIYSLFYLFKCEKEYRLKLFYLFCLPIVWGSCISLPQLFSTKELSDYAWRVTTGYDFFSYGSLNPIFLPSLFFPFIFGGGYSKVEWPNWSVTESSGFVGILVIVLALLSFIKMRKKDHNVLLWGIVSIISFILVLGSSTPLYRVMYYFPVYNLFRISARNWMEFDLAIAILSAIGLNSLFYNKSKNDIKLILICLVCVFIFMTGYYEIGKSVNSHNSIKEFFTQSAQNLFDATFTKSNLAIIVPFAFIIAYVLIFLIAYKRQNTNFLMATLSTMIILETYSFGGFHETIHLPDVKKVEEKSKSEDNLFLKNNLGINRAFYIDNDLIPLFNSVNKLNTINGYDPLTLDDMHSLLGMTPAGICENYDTLLKNNLILSALNTKYVLINKSLSKNYDMNKIYASNVHYTSNNIYNNDKVNTIKSKDGKSANVISNDVSIKPNTTYIISCDTYSSKKPTASLTLDFYGDNYDNPEQELDIEPNSIDKNKKTYVKVINSGEKAPNKISFRVFSYSKEPIYVSNMKITELSNYMPMVTKSSNNNVDKMAKQPIYNYITSTQKYDIYENTNYLPRFFSVEKLESTKDINEITKKFLLLEFNPNDSALLSNEDISKIGQTSFKKGKIEIEQIKDDKITLKTNFEDKGFIVLTDQYFPGWIAQIDGINTSIYKTNGASRGVVIPKGTHTLVFKYSPVKIYITFIISIISIIASVVVLFYERHLRNKNIKFNS